MTTDADGLTEAQVQRQRELYGWNTTGEDEWNAEPVYAKIIEQLSNPLIGLLLLSAVVSLVLRQFDNAIGIVLAVALVGIVGAIQESKTEATLEALRQLAPARAHVVRNGGLADLTAKELVAGDVVELRCGDRIPADILISKCNSLVVDESVLNGESAGKSVETQQQVFMGCTVSHGWGRGTVQVIGKETQFGKMVGLIKESRCANKTALQNELDKLAHKLTIGSGVLIVLISIFTYFTSNSQSLMDIVTTAVSLAVAAIPEGLPLVSTVTMALAVRRLAQKGVVVKKMSAVEAIGAVRMVCFDKTGTLTTNQLKVGKFAFEEDQLNAEMFLRLSASCTDVSESSTKGEFIGNALDVCLVKHYQSVYPALPLHKRMEAVLFSSEKRFMQVHIDDGRVIGKGAMEGFSIVSQQYIDLAKEWSMSGLRVIGVGERQSSGDDGDDDGSKFTLLGIIGFQDVLRSGASSTVKQLQSLGITSVMLTGDSEETAGAVARALSWPNPEVYSRQSPSDKLAFIDRMQRLSTTVAMVGDGVNDGAAVRRAQVGIAMGGLQSTDVARQAADIVLLNDRLDGIIEAVLEGRAICINIQRFLGFQLSSSMSSLLLVAAGGSTLVQSRLSPLHLLLLNIVMDGPPAQSLAMSKVPFASLTSHPDIRLLDLSQLLACLARAVGVVSGCVVYERVFRSASLLPPLLVMSLCNAYSWSADLRNQYLLVCVLLTIFFLVLCSCVPYIDNIVSVGRLGVAECQLLGALSALFLIVFRGANVASVSIYSRAMTKLRGGNYSKL